VYEWRFNNLLNSLNIHVCSLKINTGFINIECYENKYFTSDGIRVWNMIIFIPQSCLYRNNSINLYIIYIFLFILTLQFERISVKFCVLAEFKRKKSSNTPLKIRKICFNAVTNKFLQWNYGKMKMHILFNQYFSIFHSKISK
jgi:hypothetical protein